MRTSKLSVSHIKRIFICLFIFGWAPLLQAKEHVCEKTITISAANDWPPYSYKENGVFKGLDIEIIELLLQDVNICWNYVAFPSSSRAFSEFQKDHVDLIFAASYTSNRRGFAEFSVAYRTEIMQLFSHISQPPLQKSPKGRFPLALNNAIVAINRGSVYGPAFSHFQAQCTDCVIELSESIDRFELIKHKRVNFAVEDLLSGAYLIKNNTQLSHSVRATHITVHSNPVHYMLRPGMFSEKKLREFNLAIINNKCRIETLTNQYKAQLTTKEIFE
ncbi:hypothetical protein CWB96_07795 [Pseudoalteromonas citrea]|uniref:Solute-binding protein family 3/N-terminal domain-containing protein n=1 Tax=Pseudoalteromonas citrea TaxID=43655 RepID=A0A5S3XR10_9GAMM|nr:transporter substrate-binding domain-containing protein [Pseudoalteromonas citrea]TMP41042.1 hypothetical protein CWB97_15985 [Pseudoalteromonas citrea]TMP60108.1 hypothetical protein CWB96_07795 [Pseudoalteromonas citrea]